MAATADDQEIAASRVVEKDLRFETCETCEQTFQNLRGEICRSLSAAPLAFSDSEEPFGSFPQIAPLAPLAFSDSDALMHTFGTF